MTSRTLPPPILPGISTSTATTSTISGTAIQINSQNTNFGYPVTYINTINGTVVPESGISVNRGASAPANFVWSESDGAFEAGLGATRARVGLVDPVTAGAGFLKWNGTVFVPQTPDYLARVDQQLGAGDDPTFGTVTLDTITANGNPMHMPVVAGTTGQALVTDGSGQLFWSTVGGGGGGGGGDGTRISNLAADTQVTTDNQTVAMTAAGTQVATFTAAAITARVPFLAGSAMTFTASNMTTSRTVATGETVIVFKGTAPATLTLPTVTVGTSRFLLIENTTVWDLTVAPAVGDLIDSNSNPIILNPDGTTTMMISDGNGNWILI